MSHSFSIIITNVNIIFDTVTEMKTFIFTDLGTGWGPMFLESEQEWNFIEQILGTDRDQDYFIGGSISDETYFLLFPTWGSLPLSFSTYTPKTSGNIFLNKS